MRQRNDSGSALHVSAWPTDDDPDRSPFDVAIGEEIDFPELLAGFTSLEPPKPGEPVAEEAADATEQPTAKPKTRKGASADAPEGSDPR